MGKNEHFYQTPSVTEVHRAGHPLHEGISEIRPETPGKTLEVKPVSLEAPLTQRFEEQLSEAERLRIEAETNLGRVALIYGGQMTLFQDLEARI